MVKKYKKDDACSYALGGALVVELLKNKPAAARCVYVSPKASGGAAIELARKNGVEIIESEKAFNILSPKENCFVIGVFDKFEQKISGERHHVVLVNPSDCGNLGTIMREVAAFDCADLVIIRPAADPFDPKTVRASMGAVFNIGFKCYNSFDEYIKEFADREVVPFMLNGSPLSKTEFSRNKKYSLTFGNEATGLPESFEKYGAVRIEQSDKLDSLNLSVAAAVALYKLYSS
ncbi:MAG: TrmH family RNA methyltransferase [Clostridiales bacterium]|nr:TrmH family RNA methyltransferase [Clostridiales bacterium]